MQLYTVVRIERSGFHDCILTMRASGIRVLRVPRLATVFCEAVSVDARQEVIGAAEARALALANADSRALGDLLHEEFRWTSHTGESFTRSEYIERNTAGSVAWRSQRFDDIDVAIVGDVAVLRVEVTDEITTRDGSERFRMAMTQVWVRQDDRWRCLAGHAGPRRP